MSTHAFRKKENIFGVLGKKNDAQIQIFTGHSCLFTHIKQIPIFKKKDLWADIGFWMYMDNLFFVIF
jgi:hypothetical protein